MEEAMGIVGWAALAWAGGGAERLSVSMGLSGFGSPDPSGGSLGVGYVSVRFAQAAYLDLGGRTGLLLGPLREVSGVNVNVRLHTGKHLFWRAGLVHQHETPWDTFLSDPLGTIVGAGHGIGHRSGLDAGVGYRWTLPAVSTSGVHVGIAGMGVWLPDDDGPRVYGVLETLLTIDLGKPEE
jgi:hypothetical protein